MRVDVQLNDDELALLSGYNRSTTMGIRKPGELQRELLSDMENIEEKRMVPVPEVENESEDSKDAAPVKVRADFLSMLSGLAKPDTNKAGIDEDAEGDDGILPDDEDEEIDGDDGGILPDDDESGEDNGERLSDDDEDDEEDFQGGVLPDDDEEDFQDGVLPDDDEEDSQGVTLSEGVASEGEASGISLEDDDEDDSWELPEDEDEDDSGELPEDEDEVEDGSGKLLEDEDEDDSWELPEDEDEDGSGELPEDEDEDASGGLPADEDEDGYEELPEDEVEEAPESTEESTEPDQSRITPVVAEKPVSSTSRRQKIAGPVNKQSAVQPAGYSTSPVSLYDFILNNGGSMLIEDVKKYYPIDEVKKALNLGKIYRFGNKVGV